MAYQNYSGLWLAQSDANYEWLADERATVVPMAGIDTAKIWQSYTLAPNAPLSNLVVFGDRNYAAGNDQANVIKAAAPGVLIYGARGEDVFVGSGGSGTTFIVGLGEGNKVIQNFTEGADHLRLIGGNLTTFEAVKGAMTQQGSDVVLNDGGTMIAFRNATVGQFHAGDFQLPIDYASLGTPVFSEEFNDPRTIGTNWVTNYGYAGDGLNSFTLPGNGEQQLYTSAGFKGTSGAPLGLDPFSFANGVMTITAKPVSDATAGQMWGYHYSSGMIESNFAQTYGYFEVRAELPHGQGLWPAFWLLGAQNREIDVLEALGSNTKVSNNAIHSQTVPALGNASFNPYGDGFHTYGTLWTPQTITFYVDGTPVWQTSTPSEMSTPMKMIVNLAVGGNWPGSPDASTPFPAEMKVDHVRVYNLPDPNYHAPSSPPPPPPPPPPVSPPPPPPPPVSGAGVVLSADHAGSTLTGGSGTDTLNASQGADRLTGGAGADVFAFKAMPWSAGHITDFQVGVDKLDLSALYLGGYRGSDPVADGYVSFVSDGAGGTKVLVDPDGRGTGQAWPFTVVTLDGVSASGLTAAQVFNAAGGTTAPPPSGTAGVVLTAGYPGAPLTGGAGADTLIASQGSGQLTGGAGADVFAFKAMPWSAGHITDFQVGVDKLDLSALYAGGYSGSDPVADGYVTFVSDGAGGTKVMLDPDGRGTAQAWPFTVVTLDGVSASGLTAAQVFNGAAAGGAAPPSSGAAGQVLTSAYPGATLAGGAGADTLNASQGADQLTGGAGADHFVLNALPWSAGHITDFQHGVDVLDLRPLFAAAGYQGGDPIADGYLRLESDGAGGTKVSFDRDGWGSGNPWPTTLTTLDHVAPSTLTSADWLFH